MTNEPLPLKMYKQLLIIGSEVSLIISPFFLEIYVLITLVD